MYLAVILDVYTRQVWGWELGRSQDPGLTLTALERALRRGTPEIHHFDQGVQYACPAYVERLQAVGAQIRMAERGCSHQNGHAEQLLRTIKEEVGAFGIPMLCGSLRADRALPRGGLHEEVDPFSVGVSYTGGV